MTIFPGAPAANAASQKKKNRHSKSASNVGTGGFDLPEKIHRILIRKHRDGQAIKSRRLAGQTKMIAFATPVTKMRSMKSPRRSLFAKKSGELLLKDAGSAYALRPILGPLQLTSLGIGAIIGAGIFVIIGVVAKDKAGAATMLSFVVAGTACGFAALCYAEFASMVPLAGSAYTYAYATLGELFAW